MSASLYSAVSLFAGCGGSDLGLRNAGVEVIWANDVNPAACELYEHVTGSSVIHQGDIAEFDRFPKADLLVGCYPCQGYSQGGRRSQSDKINYLYREFDRCLRQVRPLGFIVENVDGMRFAQNRGLLNNQIIRFRLAGYRVAWRVLDAKDYGLAQDRKRLFIVGVRSSHGARFTFPKPSHGPQAPDGKSRKTLRDTIWHLRNAEAGTFCDEPFHWYYLSRNRRRDWHEQASCVVAHWRHVGLHPDSPRLKKVGKDRWEFAAEGNARRLSYLECAAIQGFPRPKAFKRVTLRQRFAAIGNAVPPPLFESVVETLIRCLQNHV